MPDEQDNLTLLLDRLWQAVASAEGDEDAHEKLEALRTELTGAAAESTD